jgi:hypothetical protein
VASRAALLALDMFNEAERAFFIALEKQVPHAHCSLLQCCYLHVRSEDLIRTNTR